MTTPNPKNIVHLNVRIPMHLLNKLERKAIEQNTSLSKVVRQTFEKSK